MVECEFRFVCEVCLSFGVGSGSQGKVRSEHRAFSGSQSFSKCSVILNFGAVVGSDKMPIVWGVMLFGLRCFGVIARLVGFTANTRSILIFTDFGNLGISSGWIVTGCWMLTDEDLFGSWLDFELFGIVSQVFLVCDFGAPCFVLFAVLALQCSICLRSVIWKVLFCNV